MTSIKLAFEQFKVEDLKTIKTMGQFKELIYILIPHLQLSDLISIEPYWDLKCSDIISLTTDIRIKPLFRYTTFAGFTRYSVNGIIFEFANLRISKDNWINIPFSRNDLKSGHDVDCHCPSSYLDKLCTSAMIDSVFRFRIYQNSRFPNENSINTRNMRVKNLNKGVYEKYNLNITFANEENHYAIITISSDKWPVGDTLQIECNIPDDKKDLMYIGSNIYTCNDEGFVHRFIAHHYPEEYYDMILNVSPRVVVDMVIKYVADT